MTVGSSPSIACSEERAQILLIFFAAYPLSDYNMDLVIALEMSRLQMIEDQMKQSQRNQQQGSG